MVSESVIPSSLRISASKNDFEALLFQDSSEREGFQRDGDSVQIPVFISKLNGGAQDFIARVREHFRLYPSKSLMFSGFHVLKKLDSYEGKISNSVISEDGEIDVVLAGQMDEIRQLKSNKRRILYSVIKSIVTTKGDIEAIADLSAFDVFLSAVMENEKILSIFNNDDYDDTPPKCVIIDSAKSTLNAISLVRLLLMHRLGFDIVVASYKSNNSIEDYFPEDFYDIYQYEEVKKNYAVTKEKKSILPILLWGGFALIIIYVVLHWGLSII